MKIFFTVSAMALLLFSCKSNGPSETAKKNLEITHQVNKAFETGEVNLLNDIISPDFIDHRDVGDVKGLDSLKAMATSVHKHIKDMKVDIVREMADDEYVMSWLHYKGTGDGQEGMMAGPFEVSGTGIYRLKDGKVVEHWEHMDMRDVMKMMSSMAPPVPIDSMPAPNVDTSASR
jgi:predicted SnoaL-like aldol condensation-catalyzing enzyme